jgi:hypothetical protein
MRHRRGRALRRRYGRASSHPLFPRLVMTLKKLGMNSFEIEGKLQKHYGGVWHVVSKVLYPSARAAREDLHTLGDAVAYDNDVPQDHVEYA